MKSNIVKLWLLGAFLLGACQEEDVVPAMSPLIGEWEAAEGQFLALTVDGEEKTKQEFGVEVLKVHETVAERATLEYLQDNFLGPIDGVAPKLVFSGSDQLSATVAGEQLQGIWHLQNEGTVLKLVVPGLYENGFFFNLRKLTMQELQLDWSWDMTFLGDEGELMRVGLVIKLVR
ncbi:hypothetical protein ADIS_1232 [Lunatimonas lonarensis]|uniref:Lipocalin-like domain-containing protein n=1 Tax=Lunatimonas lonarensis TaxID=1232681 RepID=R7ZWI7_9BACT|nr:hypothetical protein [Lunatimonas lonarensis]EON78369.1 hypothetical protein ADIS_1232 [Lunatimonas lonarensis]